MTDTSEIHGPILLACHEPGCNARARAQLGHLDNLLAAGPWRCTEHRETVAC